MADPEMAARDVALALLEARAPDRTVCPSEVARALAAASGEIVWRSTMPTVHAAIDTLLAERLVQLSWKGKSLAIRAGPYRIGRNAIRQ
ncbi:MAG: DUF3253 domain-containing protein [Pseudomonadota bacterium]|nr:DUF3253 domain-containing protein [Pseudomonadota bacterium]